MDQLSVDSMIMPVVQVGIMGMLMGCFRVTYLRTRERRDQSLGRMTTDKVAGNELCGGIYLVLAVEGSEQGRADFLGSNG